MAFTVKVDVGYEFEVKAPFDEVFDLLADVPLSVSHFPKVASLVDLGDNAFRWEMEKVGTDAFHIQTVYASKYVPNKAKGEITWTPVKGVGNAQVSGIWNITDKGNPTLVVLETGGDMDIPLPGLMKMVVGPVVKSEFDGLVRKYIENLIDRFGGEV